jgi:chromosome segregation ATPase
MEGNKMLRDSVLEQLDKELQKLRSEQNRILEQIKALEERREWEEQKVKLEAELRETFTELLKINWQTIPKFLNESYARLRGMASEYDELRLKEMELIEKFNGLKKELAINDTEIAKIRGEIHKTIGDPVELILEIKRLFQFFDENDITWIQNEDSIFRFLDVKREVLQLKW